MNAGRPGSISVRRDGSSVVAVLYLVWLGFAIAIPLLATGLDTRNTTLLGAVVFLIVQLSLARPLSRLVRGFTPRRVFLAFGLLAACFLEAFHMISQPFHSALLITRGMSAGEGLNKLLVDLVFTLPSYLLVFAVIWRLLQRYGFSPIEYGALVSLGQCLGDGGLLFFLEAPSMLLFLPYTLVKYQAMNALPYLLIKDTLAPGDRSWQRLLVPVPVIVATYFVCGTLSQTLWTMMGLPA